MARNKNLFKFAKSPRNRNQQHRTFQDLENRLILKFEYASPKEVHQILWSKDLSSLRDQFFRSMWRDTLLEKNIQNKVSKLLGSK